MQWPFGLFEKIKKGCGTTFDAHFLHDLSLFNTLSMDKVSMS